MNIFYIDVEKFKQNNSKEFLSEYSDREFKNEKRFYEYTIGRYLIKNVAKNIYKIADDEIAINEKGKPVFEYSNLCFSLSHSKNYIIACFDEYRCGIDIEFIKERNFENLSYHYGRNFRNTDEFYSFWTFEEAKYKLGTQVKDFYTTVFKNDYYLTVVSEKIFDKNIEIIHFN